MIDFLKYRYVCLVLSLVMVGAGVAGYVIKGGFKYHIDFVGGTTIHAAFKSPITINTLRKQLEKHEDWKESAIQSVGTPEASENYNEFFVTTADASDGVEDRFKESIKDFTKDNPIEIRGVDRVGPEVGKNITWNAIIAVLLSLLIILAYVGLRSKYRYAAGAVVAIAHDMFAVLVIFLLLGEPISVQVLAAVLAILGYSLNDTIVIFSRVRENLKKLSGTSEVDIVNLSINQTLRRTLLTSISTLLTVLSIYFLGGEALGGFALAMMIGVVAGTYSSVYIASPVMLAIKTSSTNA